MATTTRARPGKSPEAKLHLSHTEVARLQAPEPLPTAAQAHQQKVQLLERQSVGEKEIPPCTSSLPRCLPRHQEPGTPCVSSMWSPGTQVPGASTCCYPECISSKLVAKQRPHALQAPRRDKGILNGSLAHCVTTPAPFSNILNWKIVSLVLRSLLPGIGIPGYTFFASDMSWCFHFMWLKCCIHAHLVHQLLSLPTSLLL